MDLRRFREVADVLRLTIELFFDLGNMVVVVPRLQTEVINPGTEPGSNVPTTGYRRQIIDESQQVLARECLNHAEIKGGTTNASAGKGQADDVLLEWPLPCRHLTLDTRAPQNRDFLGQHLLEREALALARQLTEKHNLPLCPCVKRSCDTQSLRRFARAVFRRKCSFPSGWLG